jgi:UV DNA damage repair endonuclease
MNKIGFACKYVGDPELEGLANMRSVSRTWADRNSDETVFSKLREVSQHNIRSLKYMVDYVHTLPPELHMFRMSSEVLPLYTIERYRKMHDQMHANRVDLFTIGMTLRKYGILVSFHPGQFVCLASDREDVVINSIAEIEYHADVAEMMGFGRQFQDGCKINVHVSGKLGPMGFRSEFGRLSDTAQNLLTIENDEYTIGLDEIIQLKDVCPIVLDVHHHWVKTGEYVDVSDWRVGRVIESWKHRTPSMHYAVSREDLLIDHPIDVKPDLEQLLSKGFKKGKLRAHSEYYWNTAVNEWASTFRPHFNIMCESKMKNLASIKFYEEIK